MSATSKNDIVREALLFAARSRRPGDELKCRALIGLMETCHTLGTALRSELAQTSLTENGFRILAHVIHQEPLAVVPSTLAELLNLSPQSVSSVLGRLEISALITRERDERDHRVFSVRATPRGVSSFQHAVRRLLEAIARLLSAIDHNAIAQLDQTCAQLRTASSSAAST